MRSALVLAAIPLVTAAAPPIDKIDLFESRQGGYLTYRIPGLVVTAKGTLLAYVEARKDGIGDWANIDILARRGSRGGKTWDAPKLLADAGSGTANNPVAIAARGGTVHFLYCANYARAFYMRSDDDGRTFSAPAEITSVFERFRPDYNWNVIATGPGHGIELRTGRLVVPVWLSTGGKTHRPSVVSVIYSDDQGQTWQRGDLVPNVLKNMSETTAVELAGGRVLLNIRNESPEHRRAISLSADGAINWSKPAFDEALVEPICMASIVRIGKALAFSNPDSLEPVKSGPNAIRKNLTVRWSDDEGKTWPVARVIEPGISAYSDLAAGRDGVLYCLYERGGVNQNMFDTQYITLARIR